MLVRRFASPSPRRTRLLLVLGIVAAQCSIACETKSSRGADKPTSELVHLDQELADARVTSARAPELARAERSWRFDEPRAEWHVISSEQMPSAARVTLAQLADCARISLTEPDQPRDGPMLGGLVVDLPDEPRNAWTAIRVRARSHARLAGIAVVCNLGERGARPNAFGFFKGASGTSPVFNDGSVQEYVLPLPPQRDSGDTLRNVGFVASAMQAAELDVLAVTLVPRGAAFLDDTGVRALERDGTTRRTLFAHAPASLAFGIRVPDGGRFDVGLACLESESITYRASVKPGSGAAKVLLDEKLDDATAWHQRSLDLSPWAGQQIELTLEASSELEGAVALWGAPIVSGRGRSSRPNVVFYVIDGAGADLMSVYGYNRRTTPYLERLAAEGVVFERAHSNATWTQPSTASFMTSLHHSVLGGLRRGIHSTPVPPTATTMAEHMARGGYQTSVLTSNPNCARMIGLERGVDFLRDSEGEHSRSSVELHEQFWRLRRDYPGQPYWVHFQTTDVHEPNEPSAPYAGLFVTPQEREHLDAMDNKLWQKGGELFGTMAVADFYDTAIERAGIDRNAYYNARRGLYDETMAHQDRELARFVETLKAAGEWENTLLVIGADHGHPAGTFARFGRGLIEPRPDSWQGALFDSYSTRVPLIFIWPAKIPGGRRIEQAVSMIDVLPTILDLCGLPAPEIMQGRSLAPLCLGGKLDPKPVILDEFRVDEATGEMIGNIEIIDGRWGASLEIAPVAAGADASRGRHPVPAGGRWGAVHQFFPDATRMLLYDLASDPFATRAVNDEHPELVERYERELREHWRVHQALATRFGEAGEQEITPEMLKQLQSLGYVR